MARVGHSFKAFGRRVSWLLFVKIMLCLVVFAYAATISVTSTSYQAEVGSLTTFPSGLIATDKGFAVSYTAGSSAGTSCSTPVQFGLTPKTANTTIVAGHFVYDVQVNTTVSVPTAKFNVTLVLGSAAPYGPLCIQSLGVPNETIDCRFDVGPVLPASPYTFKVTIQ
jgi:hypothetical protein